MATTELESSEYANVFTDSPPTKLKPDQLHGRLRIATVTCTQVGVGDATSDFSLVKLPPGRVTVLGLLSNIYFNWTTASATADFGWDAYTDFDGNAVTADTDGLDNAIDVELAGNQTICSIQVAAGSNKTFESKDGVVLRLTSQDQAIANGNVAIGTIVYVVD